MAALVSARSIPFLGKVPVECQMVPGVSPCFGAQMARGGGVSNKGTGVDGGKLEQTRLRHTLTGTRGHTAPLCSCRGVSCGWFVSRPRLCSFFRVRRMSAYCLRNTVW